MFSCCSLVCIWKPRHSKWKILRWKIKRGDRNIFIWAWHSQIRNYFVQNVRILNLDNRNHPLLNFKFMKSYYYCSFRLVMPLENYYSLSDVIDFNFDILKCNHHTCHLWQDDEIPMTSKHFRVLPEYLLTWKSFFTSLNIFLCCLQYNYVHVVLNFLDYGLSKHPLNHLGYTCVRLLTQNWLSLCP